MRSSRQEKYFALGIWNYFFITVLPSAEKRKNEKEQRKEKEERQREREFGNEILLTKDVKHNWKMEIVLGFPEISES
jgi:hypothetical protein